VLPADNKPLTAAGARVVHRLISSGTRYSYLKKGKGPRSCINTNHCREKRIQVHKEATHSKCLFFDKFYPRSSHPTNYRIVWVGNDLIDPSSPNPPTMRHHQVAQSPIQPGLEHFQS